MSAWTWETLNAADREVLEEVMRTGATPDIEQLLGHTYRGLNSGLVPRITGRRFKKVFHEHEGRPFGHNAYAGSRTSWCYRTRTTTRWCSARPTS
jgi:hypothetical protein